MVEISRQHIDAIRPMSELIDQLVDVVQAATDAAIVRDGPWKRTRGKASSGAFMEGHAIWARPLERTDGRFGNIQLGCYYGIEEGAVYSGLGLHQRQLANLFGPTFRSC